MLARSMLLHFRGLIHCCSSHVRCSRNAILLRTAGPYKMAHIDVCAATPSCRRSGINGPARTIHGVRPRGWTASSVGFDRLPGVVTSLATKFKEQLFLAARGAPLGRLGRRRLGLRLGFLG